MSTPAQRLRYCIQKHGARQLHYDLRLELGGTLKSWANPKGPALDPTLRRLAVQVPDHDLGYADFEGRIAPGQYGAGDVIVWDRGTWQPEGDPFNAYAQGQLRFTLHGLKLTGQWRLYRTGLPGSSEQWLLVKARDAAARPLSEFDVLHAHPNSVISGRALQPALKEIDR